MVSVLVTEPTKFSKLICDVTPKVSLELNVAWDNMGKLFIAKKRPQG